MGSEMCIRDSHFTAPGAGPTDATFAGALASELAVTGNTTISLKTPAGVDSSSTSLGPVQVAVTNSLGAGTASDSYTYLAGLTQVGEAHVGGQMILRLHSGTDALFVVALGFSIAPAGTPIPPFTGALQLSPAVFFPIPSTTVPVGGATEVLPVPDSPVLIGQVLEFQGVGIELPSLVGGAFTNVLAVSLLP